MKQEMTHILFVYNANGGIFSQLSDAAHKLLSPSTYACNLCKITYGNVRMKKQWKDYIESLSLGTIFLHKDEFERKYPVLAKERLPAIFFFGANQQKLASIAADELNNITTIDELIHLVDTIIKKEGV